MRVQQSGGKNGTIPANQLAPGRLYVDDDSTVVLVVVNPYGPNHIVVLGDVPHRMDPGEVRPTRRFRLYPGTVTLSND